MCLATVFLKENEENKPVLKNVTKLAFEDDSWLLTDILGKQMRLRGTIEEVDLTDNFIVICELSS